MNPLSATLLSCVSMNNQECKIIINGNSYEPVFYRIKTTKCGW